eukprot:GILJ01009279.1.p1 GENE.GILJ01009279.1~~GILJ01009279.1.p1  ORF type:complete len:139 (-),score=33.14 GILJ01009279.1:128-544(-)
MGACHSVGALSMEDLEDLDTLKQRSKSKNRGTQKSKKKKLKPTKDTMEKKAKAQHVEKVSKTVKHDKRKDTQPSTTEDNQTTNADFYASLTKQGKKQATEDGYADKTRIDDSYTFVLKKKKSKYVMDGVEVVRVLSEC